MVCKFSDLLCKEVICVCDGSRLGFVSDLRLELPEGRITAIVVPGRCRYGGICGPRDEYIIPWNCIKRIGPDIILADVKPEACRAPRIRSFFLQK